MLRRNHDVQLQHGALLRQELNLHLSELALDGVYGLRFRGDPGFKVPDSHLSFHVLGMGATGEWPLLQTRYEEEDVPKV